MNSPVNVTDIEADAISTATTKRRLSSICYLAAITVAMVGWLCAFGWVAMAAANWLSD
jgi:hypothetical protein